MSGVCLYAHLCLHNLENIKGFPTSYIQVHQHVHIHMYVKRLYIAISRNIFMPAFLTEIVYYINIKSFIMCSLFIKNYNKNKQTC